ncbi:MAG: ABC transporter permease, partial [Rhodobacteraceae bacterium]|nr:ABC transporter permease [Paracoccaceae bacterium]
GIRHRGWPDPDIPVLSRLPVLGEILFTHDPILYIGLILPAVLWWFFRYSRAGLILRAVGENHDAAHAIGYNVRMIRIAAIMFGGACAGLGGAYLSLVRVPQWTEGMTAGAGWIALAIVVFASWKPWRVLLGAWLFGGLTILQLNMQAAGISIGVEYLSMSPYLATILVLILLSTRKNRRHLDAPNCLGRGFHPTA